MSLAFKLSTLLFTLLCTCVRAQESGCIGETFVQVLRDEGGQDLRATCVIPYPGSDDLLIGGTVGGNIFLTRISRDGTLRWRRSISTPSLSTELSTLAEVLVDEQGMIAGAGSTFDADNEQLIYVFRYDPLADSIHYLYQPPFPSEATGLKLGAPGEYLLSGSKNGEPPPVFNSAFLARIDRQTGIPIDGGNTLDLGGDESILDLQRLPDGTTFSGGRTSLSGGTGATRANLTRLAPDGTHEWTRVGYAASDANARLFTFDVEVVGNTVYVLSWGNVGVITASLGTSMVLSAFDLDGTPRWTRLYDITEFDGEEALDLIPYQGGLLAYGFGLIARRTPFLIHTGPEGDLRWAKTYELPGTATLYVRCNQQILTDDDGIVMLATYSGTGRPREGTIFGLDANGLSDNACLEVRDIAVAVSNLNATWAEATLEATPQTIAWATSPSAVIAENLAAFDDCDIPCDDCFERTFTRRAICQGDALNLGGIPRTESGVYADTIPNLLTGCDSIRLTELAISNGPEVSVRILRNCGLVTADVQLTTSGGEFPYSYSWSAPDAAGPRVSLPPGNYQVTVDDALGCNPTTVEVAVEATPPGGPEFRFNSPFCPGDSTGFIRLEPPGSGSIRLLPDGDFSPDPISGLPAGSYSVLLRDTTGCEAFRQITITPARPAVIQIEAPRLVRLGDRVNLGTTNAFGSFFSGFNWSSADSLSCENCPNPVLLPTVTGRVLVDAVTERGCPVSDSLLIRVTTGPARVFIPTGFSPNEDLLNDRWVPGLGPEVESILEWQVYDRWGNQQWTYTGNEEWWTGDDASAGVYTYTLRVRLLDGREESRVGGVTLVR